MASILAGQKGRADLAENELLVLVEFRTLGIVIQALDWYVTRNAFDANHCGFPIDVADFHGHWNFGNKRLQSNENPCTPVPPDDSID
ncbi:hypothetical protein D3C81_1913520 [compost metagenome]